ncbi:MAG: ribosome biogenesis GTP-binding protein YihA/YsxC [Marinifilaceae bacterium]
MIITRAEFVISNSDVKKCPQPNLPEYAFIGRSNVGKSSLINMLTNHKGLAKISGKPGKTQLINHFLINKEWYLVDLPGYGYAKVSKGLRGGFTKIIKSYIESRENLVNLFVLVDSRHKPQQNDMQFMQWLGENGIPFSIIFTKADKLTPRQLKVNIDLYQDEMLQIWEEMPPYFASSSSTKQGKEEILNYIEQTNGMVDFGK